MARDAGMCAYVSYRHYFCDHYAFAQNVHTRTDTGWNGLHNCIFESFINSYQLEHPVQFTCRWILFFSFVAPVDIGHWNWNWNENKMNFQRFNRTTAQRTRYIILGHQMNSENNCVIGRNVEVGTVGVLLIASSNSTWSVCFSLKFLLQVHSATIELNNKLQFVVLWMAF